MKFNYIALNSSGKQIKGVTHADDESAALAALREQGIFATSIKQVKVRLGADGQEAKNIFDIELGNTNIYKRKLPRKKLIIFFQQMSIMLKSGVILSMAIDVLMENESNPYMRRILREIHNDMMAGISISASMEKFDTFDNITTNIIKSGEADGHLERSFSQIAVVIEKQHSLITKVQSAAIYPAILLVLVIGVLILLNTLILPTFITMFEATGDELPMFTQIVVSASTIMQKWWYLFVIAVVAIIVTYQYLRNNVLAVAIAIDRFKLKVPLLGALIRHSQTARFARILSTLLESGQDFLSSLEISQSVLSNKYMTAKLTNVADEVRMGNPISVSMSKLDFFEPVLISMVRAGEESGSLSETLSKMADMYEAQTDETTKRITLLMEPMMTIVIAGIVGFVVIAVALPMFNMFNLVGNV